MAESSSSRGSNQPEPTFGKIVSDIEIDGKALHLSEDGVDAIIVPNLSPEKIATLGGDGVIRINVNDVKTGHYDNVKLQRTEYGYFLFGKGISRMIEKEMFIEDSVVYFGYHHGTLHVFRE